jgi:ribonuclease BN (tRNA processing enzyme)
MTLTVLGASAACPRRGGACSGYLVQQEETRLLLDCGTGVIAALQNLCAWEDLTAIIISHMHADHFFDLIPLANALRYGPAAGALPPLPVHVPAGGTNVLLRIAGELHPRPEDMLQALRITEFARDTRLSFDSVAVQFEPVSHYIPTYAIIIQGSERITYSADTAPCEGLERAAQGADLFLCESTLQSPDQDSQPRGHLSAEEAARVAEMAKARALVLTHFWSEEHWQPSLKAATAIFHGPVEIAQEGASFRT